MSRLIIVCTLLIAAASLTMPQQAPQIPSDKSWVVEGKAVDDTGPVSDVSIKAIAHGQDLEVLTDQKGHFLLTGAAPGKYRIYPAKDGYEGGEDGDLQSAVILDLFAGTIKSVDFVVRKAASISGRILDSNRKPVQDAVVVLSARRLSGHRWYRFGQGS